MTRGAITFDGSPKLDPVLDIVAEASAADITAQVNIGGSAEATACAPFFSQVHPTSQSPEKDRETGRPPIVG